MDEVKSCYRDELIGFCDRAGVQHISASAGTTGLPTDIPRIFSRKEPQVFFVQY